MNKFWKHTWIYKSYSLIKNYSYYRQIKRQIAPTLYSKEFKLLLRKYLNLDARKDWLGRLYGIINPNINKDGLLDISSSIIELDYENTNSNQYVDFWVMKQFELIKNLFKLQNLYDYISVDIQHVKPFTLDNYLLIIDMTSRKQLALSFKSWLNMTIFYLVIAAIITLGIIFFIL